MKIKRRILSLLLCGVMLISPCAPPVFAKAGVQTQSSDRDSYQKEHTADNAATSSNAKSDETNVSVKEKATSSDAKRKESDLPVRKMISAAARAEEKGDITNSGLTVSTDNPESMVGSYKAGSGSVVVGYNENEQTLTFTLTNASINGPILITGEINAVIELNGENSISNTSNDESAVKLDNGSLTIKGSGSLEATGDVYAIYALHGITVTDVSITAEASGTAAIQANDKISISNSTVNASCSGETNELGGYGIYIYGGGVNAADIVITDSDIAINCLTIAVYTEGNIEINHSSVTADSQNSNGLYAAKGIFIQNGTEVDGHCLFPVLYAAETIQINSSKVNAGTGSNGIWSDGNLCIENTSEINTDGYYSGIGALGGVKIEDSSVNASGYLQFGILSQGDISISGDKTEVTAKTQSVPVGTGDGGFQVFPAVAAYGSSVSITGGSIDIQADDAYGMQADGGIAISGETTEVKITNSSEYYSGLYLGGGSGVLEISGGRTSITATGDMGISVPEEDESTAPVKVMISGGELSISSKKAGIYIPEDTVEIRGGKLNISSEEDTGINGKTVKITGGEVLVLVKPNINPFWIDEGGSMIFTGGTLKIPNAADNSSIKVGNEEYYLITFDAQNGTEPKTVLIEKENKLNPEKPQMENYIFDGWYNAASGGERWNLEEYTVNAHVTLYAQWKAVEYHVTVQSEGNGTASASPVSANVGTEIMLTASPASGYHFKEWMVLSGSVTIEDNHFIMPAEDVTVKAIFEKDKEPEQPPQPPQPLPEKYGVTVQCEGSGTALASPDTAEQGTEIILTVTPASGYHFKEWEVISGNVTIRNNRFTMPAEDVTVKAIFEKDKEPEQPKPPSPPPQPPQPTAKYSVTVQCEGSGTASASLDTAEQGTEITLTAIPTNGYYFKAWQVVSGNVTIRSNHFTMPAEDVTVKAIFEKDSSGSSGNIPSGNGNSGGGQTHRYRKINTGKSRTIYTGTMKHKIKSGTDTGNPFTDIKEGDWFYKDVLFVYEKGLMAGTSENVFEPDSKATRAQLAVMLYHMEGSPGVEGKNSYTDVEYGPGTAWYYDAATWVQQKDMLRNDGNGRFRFDDTITREELIETFYRYAQYKGYDVTAAGSLDGFMDRDEVSPWATKSFIWAVAFGIAGDADAEGNKFLFPQETVTRAQAAALLRLFMTRYV